MSIEASGESSEFYADDVLYYVATANNGYTGTLTTALTPDWFLTDFMGMEKDSKNNIIESADNEPKYFAMAFEFTGDASAIRHAMYYCKATTRPAIEGETKGDGVEVKTEEIEFKATPLPTTTDRPKAIIKSKTTKDSTNYDTWFTAFELPTFTA